MRLYRTSILECLEGKGFLWRCGENVVSDVSGRVTCEDRDYSR